MSDVCGDVLMGITHRPIQWRTASLRPVPMPSVQCPRVHQLGSEGVHVEWLGCSHCLGCALMHGIKINGQQQTGEVRCAG